MDALWSKASTKGKEWMAGELVASESQIQSNTFGKFIHQNLALSTFKRASRDEWRQVLESKAKKADMAKEFMSGLEPVKKPKAGVSDREKKRPAVKAEEEQGFVIDTVFEYGLGEEEIKLEAASPPPK